MHHLHFILSALLPLILFTAPAKAVPPSPFSLERIEKGVVYVKDASSGKSLSFATGLEEIKYLGPVLPSSGEPYFLVAGRDCGSSGVKCDSEELMVEAFRATPSPRGTHIASFTHPGKLLEHKSRQVVFESRAFFGQCLSDRTSQVFVSFQREKIGNKRPRMQNSLFVAEAGPDFFREKLQEKRNPSLNPTLALVKKKLCTEISPANRILPNRALFDWLSPSAGNAAGPAVTPSQLPSLRPELDADQEPDSE